MKDDFAPKNRSVLMLRAFFVLSLAVCLLFLQGGAATAVELNTGDFLLFGRWAYELETGATAEEEPLFWKKAEDGTCLSVYLPKRQAWGGNEWSSSDLYEWLNETFLNTAFSDQERGALLGSGGSFVTLPDDAVQPGDGTFSVYGTAGYYPGTGNSPYWTSSIREVSISYVDVDGRLQSTTSGDEQFGVRPLVSPDWSGIVFKSASAPLSAGEPGTRDNPFVLYPQGAETIPSLVSADVLATRMTLRFSRAAMPAYRGAAPDGSALAGKFDILKNGNSVTAGSTEVTADSVILSLSQPIEPGSSLQVRYRPIGDDDSDAIGFIDDIPAILSGLSDGDEGTISVTVRPYLTALSLSSGALSPAFQPTGLQYTASVANTTASVSVTAAAAGTASATVNGQSSSDPVTVPLTVGQNHIAVVVTDAGNVANATTYTIVLTRAAAPVTTPPTTPQQPATPAQPQTLSAVFSNINSQSGGLASVSVIPPGLYVQVLDGLINVTNPGGTLSFGAGQFGFIPSMTIPPVVLPVNPGLKFMPPPAFSAQLPVGAGSGTTGNTVPVDFKINLSGLTISSLGADPTVPRNRTSAADAELLKLLNERNLLLAAASQTLQSWTALVSTAALRSSGTGFPAAAALSWEEALEKGIVRFSDQSMGFRFVLIDYEGGPIDGKDALIVPDGIVDGQIESSIWLLQGPYILPQSVSIAPSSLRLGAGGSATVKAVVAPEEAADKTLLWTVSDATVARIEKTTSADIYRVDGLAAGEAVLTATVSADQSIAAKLTVTVVSDDTLQPPISSSSGGGCSAFSAAGLAVLALTTLGAAILRKRKS